MFEIGIATTKAEREAIFRLRYPSLSQGGKIRVGIIDESRGCLFSCPFCVQSSRPDNRFRAKSVGRIIEEVHRLYQRGYRLFRFGGQMTPGKLLEQVCSALIERKIAIAFSCFGHLSFLNNVDLNLLRSGGLESLFLGVETADEEVMTRAIGRKFSVGAAERLISAARAADIQVVASFIHPLPFSTVATAECNRSFARRSRPSSIAVYLPGVYPHTPWAIAPAQYGFQLSPRFLEKTLRYKIKNLFPPRFWSPLPYSLDGKKHTELCAESEALVRQMIEDGHTMFLTDDVFLVASHLQANAQDLGSSIRRALYSGDAELLADLVARVNRVA